MSRIRLVSVLLLPLVCVVVRSAKQFRLQCTEMDACLSNSNYTNTKRLFGSLFEPNVIRIEYSLHPLFGT